MLDTLTSRLTELDPEQRLAFYEILAHQLTIAIRATWSEETASPDERLDRVKWINEILHGVTSKVRCLRLKTHDWTEQDSVADMRHWILQNSAIRGDVEFAIRLALKAVGESGSENC